MPSFHFFGGNVLCSCSCFLVSPINSLGTLPYLPYIIHTRPRPWPSPPFYTKKNRTRKRHDTTLFIRDTKILKSIYFLFLFSQKPAERCHFRLFKPLIFHITPDPLSTITLRTVPRYSPRPPQKKARGRDRIREKLRDQRRIKEK